MVLTNRLSSMSDSNLADCIAEDALPCYPSDQPSKPLQIEAVIKLVRLQNTLMAGTGFGKSCIPEMYLVCSSLYDFGGMRS